METTIEENGHLKEDEVNTATKSSPRLPTNSTSPWGEDNAKNKIMKVFQAKEVNRNSNNDKEIHKSCFEKNDKSQVADTGVQESDNSRSKFEGETTIEEYVNLEEKVKQHITLGRR